MTLQDLLAGLGGRCEVEIGCGNGHFLAAYALERRDTLLVGVDLKKKRCMKARLKAERRGLDNVQVLNTSAESFVGSLPPGSVDAFHIYFPDPWPKSRHRKRRLFTMESLRELHARLKADGRLYFGTDFFDYYLQAKVLVALHEGFQLRDEPAPQAVLSSAFGQKFVEVGKSIYLFTAVRLPVTDGTGLGSSADQARPASADQAREQQHQEREVHGDVEDEEKAGEGLEAAGRPLAGA